MSPGWGRVPQMEPEEAVQLLLEGVPEYERMYREEAPLAIGEDGEPLLHIVFGSLALSTSVRSQETGSSAALLGDHRASRELYVEFYRRGHPRTA